MPIATSHHMSIRAASDTTDSKRSIKRNTFMVSLMLSVSSVCKLRPSIRSAIVCVIFGDFRRRYHSLDMHATFSSVLLLSFDRGTMVPQILGSSCSVAMLQMQHIDWPWRYQSSSSVVSFLTAVVDIDGNYIFSVTT